MSHGAKSTAYATKTKPSRNATCPCGSGQKFKKCCIQTWEWFDLVFMVFDQGRKPRNKKGEILFEKKDRPRLVAEARKIGMIREAKR